MGPPGFELKGPSGRGDLPAGTASLPRHPRARRHACHVLSPLSATCPFKNGPSDPPGRCNQTGQTRTPRLPGLNGRPAMPPRGLVPRSRSTRTSHPPQSRETLPPEAAHPASYRARRRPAYLRGRLPKGKHPRARSPRMRSGGGRWTNGPKPDATPNEVGNDGTNFAYQGDRRALRPPARGAIGAGPPLVVFDHDTMRVARPGTGGLSNRLERPIQVHGAQVPSPDRGRRPTWPTPNGPRLGPETPRLAGFDDDHRRVCAGRDGRWTAPAPRPGARVQGCFPTTERAAGRSSPTNVGCDRGPLIARTDADPRKGPVFNAALQPSGRGQPPPGPPGRTGSAPRGSSSPSRAIEFPRPSPMGRWRPALLRLAGRGGAEWLRRPGERQPAAELPAK